MELSDSAKQQAMSAVADVRAQIQLVEMTGSTIAPGYSPNAELSQRTVSRLQQMERAGYDNSARIQAMTRDDFVRE